MRDEVGDTDREALVCGPLTAVRGNLDLVAALDDRAGVAAVAVVAEEDVAVEVAAAVVDVGAVIAVAVAEPVVRVAGAVAILDEEGVVVDAVEEVDHLVDGERAVAIVICAAAASALWAGCFAWE